VKADPEEVAEGIIGIGGTCLQQQASSPWVQQVERCVLPNRPPAARLLLACKKKSAAAGHRGEGWAAESHIQAANDCPSPHWPCTRARILQQEPLTSCPPTTRAVPTQLLCASPRLRWAKGWGSCVQRPGLVAGHGHASGGAPLHG